MMKNLIGKLSANKKDLKQNNTCAKNGCAAVRTRIESTLKAIAADECVTILYAADVGSRAWGLESPASDYDIRFIYAHPLDYYVRIDSPPDFINYKDDQIDAHGWDLKKALLMLYKNNAGLLELLNSPIVYLSPTNTICAIKKLSEEHFAAAPIILHYMSLVDRECQHVMWGDEPASVKRIAFILSRLLAAQFVRQNEHMHPLSVEKIVNVLDIENVLREEMANLFRAKQHGRETIHLSNNLIAYINERRKSIYQEAIGSLVKRKPVSIEELNNLFKDQLKRLP